MSKQSNDTAQKIWAELVYPIQAGGTKFDIESADEIIQSAIDGSTGELRNLVQEFLDYYAGNKRSQLGNGYAFKWYEKAERLMRP